MPRSPSSLALDLGVLLAVLLLPLLGAVAAGQDLRGLTEFPPPLQLPQPPTGFSWLAAGAVMLAVALLLAPWWRERRRRAAEPTGRENDPAAPPTSAFPWWGWVAAIWTAGWWTIAWTRFPAFALVQPYTFFPLWFGFIVTVNGFTIARTGTCLMQRAPRQWLGLFAASALFWWLFEWLNRFVQNWHYLGVEDFTPGRYALHASVCFSTVLPAVAAVAEALDSHQSWRQRTRSGPAWPWLRRPVVAWLLLTAGALGLFGTGMAPRWFYPALWTAPLLLLLAARRFAERRSIADDLARGDWQRAATWMAAALICGGWWELWNWHSLPKWIYTVPGVQRWHVFEMPLLGYTGYLPFGLECLLVVERLQAGRWRERPRSPA